MANLNNFNYKGCFSVSYRVVHFVSSCFTQTLMAVKSCDTVVVHLWLYASSL